MTAPTAPATTALDERRDDLVSWLLDSDPSIRWQVLRDLVGASERTVERERRRVATDGWGARLLAAQDPDGRWGGGIYSPKWTSTTYTLLLLHWLGLRRGHPQALAGCRRLWDGAQYHDGGINVSRTVGHPEACVTAMFVLLASSFGHEDDRIDPAVEWLLGQQLPDGGWNCRSNRSTTRHGSFHTSISTLDALLAYERAGGAVPVARAMADGRAFFLDHHLYRSHRTGEVANPVFTRFPFPPQWHFDIMRGLEHFRDAGAPPDPRLAEAVAAIERARRPDGTWRRYQDHAGRHWFQMEPAGPSRWATLRALRALDWWAGEPGRDFRP